MAAVKPEPRESRHLCDPKAKRNGHTFADMDRQLSGCGTSRGLVMAGLKFNMAAVKPEVLISQLWNDVSEKF